MQEIRRSFDLPTLRIWLHTVPGRRAEVVFEAVRGPGQISEIVRCGPEELGLPDRLGTSPLPHDEDFRLPDAVQAALRTAADELGTAASPPYRALWLEIASPRGYLYIVPWEKLLRPLRRPILRIPNFLLRPQTPASTVQVALCVASGDGVDATDIVALCRIWQKSSAQPTTVHVFADPGLYRELRSNPSARLDRLVLHSPYEGVSRSSEPSESGSGSDPTGSSSSTSSAPRPTAVTAADPWFAWIRDSLAGQAVDIVQLVSRGTVAGGRGGVPLLQGGAASEKVRRIVGAAEIAAFLTETGAWGLLLTAVPSRPCLPGLRELGDGVARTVPGVVILQDLRSGSDDLELVRAVQIATGRTEEIDEQLPSLTCWAHPSFLDVTDAEQQRLMVTADGHSDLLGQHTVQALSDEGTPTWIASSSRFLELQQSKWLGDMGMSETDETAYADKDVASALSSVADLLDRHAAQYLSDRGPR